MAIIPTDEYSAGLRDRAVRPSTRELLISRIAGSDQAYDLTNPPNADGYGRVRHFHSAQPVPWPDNPLPIVPAARRLGLPESMTSTGEVFQNAACNWRCWYCYVPFSLLSANGSRSEWFTAAQLVELYQGVNERPLIIDCSGGQPDLVPEWIPWMMDALEDAGIADSMYLWSDDNLSNDYFWEYLTPEQIERITAYRNYGRVGCFKGFDEDSFALNTRAAPDLFARQFHLFDRLKGTGMDLYAYVTMTGPTTERVDVRVREFIDRLQTIDRNLPLRTVPLKIEVFGVVQSRVRANEERALEVQEHAIVAWNDEIAVRFSQAERDVAITDVRWAG